MSDTRGPYTIEYTEYPNAHTPKRMTETVKPESNNRLTTEHNSSRVKMILHKYMFQVSLHSSVIGEKITFPAIYHHALRILRMTVMSYAH